MSRKPKTQQDLETENRNLRKLIVELKTKLSKARSRSKEVDELIASFDLYEDLENSSQIFELQLQAKKKARKEEEEKEEEAPVTFTLPNGEVRVLKRPQH